MPYFRRDDLRLFYGHRGGGSGTPLVLMHGLLWSSRMLERIAAAVRGRPVLLLDLHGHGKSDKPTGPDRYTWDELSADLFGLLDHVGAPQAVVGGLSLGANVAFAAAQRHPERCAGLVLEMPVLSRGHGFGKPVFGALAGLYSAGATVLTPLTGAVGRIPASSRRVPELAAVRDVASAPPKVAAAVLKGLLADEPPAEDGAALARLTMPVLVIGHPGDPLHALDDAKQLAEQLPDGRFLRASSFLHYRLRPGELARHVNEFVESID